jgi:CheY-like chemotaxis protein
MNNTEFPREKILVVDDDPSICRLLEEALEIGGYQPIVCSHPDEALPISETESFRLAFLDMNLPGMSGLELALTLKKHDPFRETVFISGYGSFDNMTEAFSAGAYDYLRKPFTLSDFNLCLRRFEERKALREQLGLARERYFNLARNIPLIVYIVRKDLQLEFVNDACYLVLGFSPEEAMETPSWFLERIHPEDREYLMDLFLSAFHGGKTSFSVECRFLHKKGHPVQTILRSFASVQGQTESKPDYLEGILIEHWSQHSPGGAAEHSRKLKNWALFPGKG